MQFSGLLLDEVVVVFRTDATVRFAIEDATTRISSDELNKVVGGTVRSGGDDDLDDLEVER